MDRLMDGSRDYNCREAARSPKATCCLIIETPQQNAGPLHENGLPDKARITPISTTTTLYHKTKSVWRPYHRMPERKRKRKRTQYSKSEATPPSVNLTALTCVTFEHTLHHITCLSILLISRRFEACHYMFCSLNQRRWFTKLIWDYKIETWFVILHSSGFLKKSGHVSRFLVSIHSRIF